jgi:hypothetical protein
MHLDKDVKYDFNFSSSIHNKIFVFSSYYHLQTLLMMGIDILRVG